MNKPMRGKKCPLGCKCKDHCGRCGDKVGKENLHAWTSIDNVCPKCHEEIKPR